MARVSASCAGRSGARSSFEPAGACPKCVTLGRPYYAECGLTISQRAGRPSTPGLAVWLQISLVAGD